MRLVSSVDKISIFALLPENPPCDRGLHAWRPLLHVGSDLENRAVNHNVGIQLLALSIAKGTTAQSFFLSNYCKLLAVLPARKAHNEVVATNSANLGMPLAQNRATRVSALALYSSRPISASSGASQCSAPSNVNTTTIALFIIASR